MHLVVGEAGAAPWHCSAGRIGGGNGNEIELGSLRGEGHLKVFDQVVAVVRLAQKANCAGL